MKSYCHSLITTNKSRMSSMAWMISCLKSSISSTNRTLPFKSSTKYLPVAISLEFLLSRTIRISSFLKQGLCPFIKGPGSIPLWIYKLNCVSLMGNSFRLLISISGPGRISEYGSLSFCKHPLKS